MELSFREEDATDLLEDVKIHANNHHKEIPIINAPLELDEEKYKDLEKIYATRCYTVRDDKDYLIGYVVFILDFHLLFKGKLFASQNALYIDPIYRKHGIGKGLLEYAENALKELNVVAIRHYVPEVNDFSGLIKNMGYNKLETVYMKEL